MTTYNGYTNYETWNFNLWYGDGLQESIQDLQDQQSEILEYGQVHEMVNGEIDNMLEYEGFQDTGFIADMVGSSISRIDIHQIATNIHNELETPEL